MKQHPTIFLISDTDTQSYLFYNHGKFSLSPDLSMRYVEATLNHAEHIMLSSEGGSSGMHYLLYTSSLKKVLFQINTSPWPSTVELSPYCTAYIRDYSTQMSIYGRDYDWALWFNNARFLEGLKHIFPEVLESR